MNTTKRVASVQRIIVTGASRGIGRAVVERLAADGRSVHAVARDETALAQLASRGEGRITTTRLDLASRGGPREALASAIQAMGAVDGLVSCAGIAPHRWVEEVDEEDIDAQVALNLRAPLLLARDLVAHLRARQAPGALVAVGSTLAMTPAPGTSVYAATKAGLTAALRTLALEVAAEGIRVNVVAPGIIDTEMIRALRSLPGQPHPDADEAQIQAQLAGFAALHPIGRLGRAEEVAEAACFLLDATFATGTVLVLDGGLTLR